MRLSILTTGFMLLVRALGDGERGAAERTLIFATYVMEEIYDSDDYDSKVASGCQGSRTGLRGQTGRCTLKELCEHLWMQSDWEVTQLGEDGKPMKDDEGKTITVPQSDSRPDPSQTGWNVNAEKGNLLDKLEPKKMIQAILAVTDKTTKKKLDKKGYYGNLNVGNAIEGATDYYETMADFGRNTWDFRQEALKVESELTPAVQNRFKKWYDHADIAAKVVVDLRMKDKYKMEELAIKDGLKRLFDPNTEDGRQKRNAVRLVKTDAGQLITNKPKELLGVDKLQMVDVGATAQALAGPLEMSEQELEDKMKQIKQAGMASEVGITHQAAIDAAQRSQKLVAGGTCG
ncbi:uncharacterized protein DSM5745_06298 [Aspergillus mulundensis]|uniref:Uncharacterized protein n=1 Tax=Aspergillus mulundensis TaxID=1810919 RepID=A0A3D8RQT7_9EURO|nr:hypothetical protein DSM5745_06298 [Aspergillus mulundensis]RDW76306.1 hypothetical protein DSM5745_06298 [Aspergillus mulundensis]